MGVSIVIGGQWGSEGKGKTTYFFSKKFGISTAIRVGGPNSGHIIVNDKGEKLAFRILPVASVMEDVNCVLPAGSYIDVDILNNEIKMSGLNKKRLKIHPNAVVINNNNCKAEQDEKLNLKIGSTESGTGNAVITRIQRNNRKILAKECEALQPYIFDTTDFIRDELRKSHEVIIEGTQGFGLSLLHSKDYPFVTSRDTSAAGFASESGISPFDVKNIIMTLRAFPIRVYGNSGPLPREITWNRVTEIANAWEMIVENTTVTKRTRRVAEFDFDVVRKAVAMNCPNIIVLNHCDYFDYSIHNKKYLSKVVNEKISDIERELGKIDYVGTGEEVIIKK